MEDKEVIYKLEIGNEESPSTFYSSQEALAFAIGHQVVCCVCEGKPIKITKVTTVTTTEVVYDDENEVNL